MDQLGPLGRHCHEQQPPQVGAEREHGAVFPEDTETVWSEQQPGKQEADGARQEQAHCVMTPEPSGV